MEVVGGEMSRNRRRWSFRVRTLLALVLVVGLPIGWWAGSAQLQRAGVAKIRAAGGWPIHQSDVVDYVHPPNTFLLLRVPRARPHPLVSWLREQLGVDYVDHVAQVSLDGSSLIKDADLVCLTGFSKLEFLNLGHTATGDAGLVHMAKLRALKFLNLDQTRVTDAGLVHLRNLDRLESLGIGHNGAAITDAGLAHLAKLKGLKSLVVGGPGITDAGLEHLRGLGNLEDLHLIKATHVTPAGMARLRLAIPRLKINLQ